MNPDLPEPQGLIPLRNVMLVRILFGFYNNFFHPKTLRAFAKLYCIVLSVVISTIINAVYISFWPCALTLFQWNFNILVSLITGDQYFFDFCRGIKLLDMRMKKRDTMINRPVSRAIYLTTVVIECIFVTTMTLACLAGYMPYRVWLSLNTVAFIWSSLNISHILQIYIFEITSHRVKMLRDSLENKLKMPCHRSQDRVTYKMNAIKECLDIYKCLLENTKSTFAPVKVLIVGSLCCSFGKALFYCYDTLNVLKEQPVVTPIFVGESVLAYAMTCLPALFADQTAYEVNKMKILIAEQVLICEDDRLLNLVEDVMEYLTMNPFKVTICRAINFDMSLPLSLAALCVTHLIVIIQMYKI